MSQAGRCGRRRAPPGGARRSQSAARDRPPVGRPGDPVHRGLRRRRALLRRAVHALTQRRDRRADDISVPVARLLRLARALGRRGVGRGHRPCDRARPRHRRARPPSDSAHLPRGPAHPRRRVRGRLRADRGGPRDRGGDWHRRPAPRRDGARRLAGTGGRSAGADRRQHRRAAATGRGQGDLASRLRASRALQRPGPQRRRARRRRTGRRARDLGQLGRSYRAGRGRRPQPASRTSPRPRSAAGERTRARRERLGARHPARSRALLATATMPTPLPGSDRAARAHPHRRPSRRAHSCTASGCGARSRRVDAREQLRAAYDRSAAIGAEGFAERARRELRPPARRCASATVKRATS